MEILLELVLWLAQFLAEMLLQVAGEALFELLGQSVKAPFRRRPASPWLAVPGHLVLGALAGAISLWFFPALFIEAAWLRVVNLALTPLAAGALMALLGAWRRSKQRATIRLDTFAYGFCFALSMALVRFFFAG